MSYIVAIICDVFTETRKDDAVSDSDVALEKVVDAELKRIICHRQEPKRITLKLCQREPFHSPVYLVPQYIWFVNGSLCTIS